MSLSNILLIPGIGSAPLLDAYPGAAFAYSFRKLRTAYSGSCVRVRRASDSTEQDFGFVAGRLDTAAIATFVGAGDGLVTTWYDQSGNGRDFVQATTTLQPFVAKSGVLCGGVRVELGAVGRRITNTFSTLQNLPVSMFDVTQSIARNTNAFGNVGFIIGGTSGGFQGRYEIVQDDTGFIAQRRNTSGAITLAMGATANQKNAFAVIYGASNINARANNVVYGPQALSGTAFTTASTFQFGTNNTSNISMTAEKQELVVYLTDQTANAAAIHSNQRSYWGTV